jgi:hypothetical protein
MVELSHASTLEFNLLRSTIVHNNAIQRAAPSSPPKNAILFVVSPAKTCVYSSKFLASYIHKLEFKFWQWLICVKHGIHDTSFASKSPFKKTWIKKTWIQVCVYTMQETLMNTHKFYDHCYSIFSFIRMFCRSLFVLLYFFFWPLRCLFFFEIPILITPLYL